MLVTSATAQFHEGIYAALALVAFGGLLLMFIFWPKRDWCVYV